jgi:isoamylase
MTMQLSRSGLPTFALAVLWSLASCSNSNYTHLYETKPFAPDYTADDVASLNHLGATVVDNGINFGVYSENATKIQVLLFDSATSAQPIQQFDLTRQGSAAWNVWVSGIGLNEMYGYIAWGPNWPYDPQWTPGTITGFISDVDGSGNRFNPNKLLQDPWAQMVTGQFDWATASAASGPDRTVMTYGAGAKSITVQSQYTWSANEATWITARQNPNMPGHRMQDLVVYETHPKGFTASPASGVAHPGTFRGVGEDAAYLKDLGITAVELMPSMFKSTDGGYWGYDTIGFFIPELTYTVGDPSNPAAAIDEFKWMVDQLHQNGIEVFMDVVYNHTGEGGLWQNEIQQDDVPPLPDGDPTLLNFDPKEVASMLSFRGFDNSAWYCLSVDNQTYWDNSGVGQDTRANHPAMKRLITDSLHYWVQQMHVDGFRFDEAAVLGEPDSPGNYNGFSGSDSVLQTIIDDPILQAQNTRITAEPWSGGGDFNSQFPASTTTPGYGWGEWNGPFRDYWRSLINCDGSTGVNPDGCGATTMTVGTGTWTPIGNLATAGFELYGSQNMFQPNGRKVTASWNYVTIHDGMTMYDLTSYDAKQNACGPLNPACCTDQVFTSECSQDDGTTNNISRDWGQDHEDVKRELVRDMFTLLLVSNGTPMLLGGDEWMRTQLGNNNAYSTEADNSSNWYDWGSWQPNAEKNRMHDFVRQVIALRKQFGDALAPSDYGSGAPVSWEDATAGTPANWNSRHLAVHYPKTANEPELEILINMETGVPAYSSNAGPLLGTTTCPGDTTYVASSPTGYDGVCACTQDADCPSPGTCSNNVCQINFTLPTGTWARLVDTQTYFDEDSYFGSGSANASANASVAAPQMIPGTSYTVEPHSIVILENMQ